MVEDSADGVLIAHEGEDAHGLVWVGEIVNRHRDGHLYTEEQTISPVRDESGQITHFVAVKQEVTERRRMEEGLRAANKTLKEQLAEVEALQAKLRDQAIRDALTGVFNRRCLSETLVRETARAPGADRQSEDLAEKAHVT